ncbi:MAG: hypothetical protein EBS18_02820 [Actinobacteria bacterium]|nr:hypothetical protein [Actinomycetota bacterium]
MIITNLNLVKTAVTRKTSSLDIKVRLARDEMMTAMIQLAQHEIKGQRKEGEKAEAGQPPKNRTGNLRRSIKGFKFASGYARYNAIVGPTMTYSRAVELGGKYAPPSWQGTSAMKGFPYMQPAYKKFLESKLMNKILLKHIGSII